MLRHAFDSKVDSIKKCEAPLFRYTNDGTIGISICHMVPASMKAATYKVQTAFTKDKLIHGTCICKIGGSRDDNITCVHTLVLPYLLTVLLTSGYLAEHLLLELTNCWKQEFDTILDPQSILSIKDSITKLVVATGWFETNSVKCNSKKNTNLTVTAIVIVTVTVTKQ